MKTIKVNFTIPKDVHDKLRELVGGRKRSSFVTEAVRGRLEEIEEERIRRDLIQGYIECREEDRELNAEWEPITLESWPP